MSYELINGGSIPLREASIIIFEEAVMFHKCKDYRRHQNNRIITKRQKIATIWGWNYKDGVLRKHNMSYNCGKYCAKTPNGGHKPVDSLKTKYKKRVMEEEIFEALLSE